MVFATIIHPTKSELDTQQITKNPKTQVSQHVSIPKLRPPSKQLISNFLDFVHFLVNPHVPLNKQEAEHFELDPLCKLVTRRVDCFLKWITWLFTAATVFYLFKYPNMFFVVLGSSCFFHFLVDLPLFCVFESMTAIALGSLATKINKTYFLLIPTIQLCLRVASVLSMHRVMEAFNQKGGRLQFYLKTTSTALFVQAFLLNYLSFALPWWDLFVIFFVTGLRTWWARIAAAFIFAGVWETLFNYYAHHHIMIAGNIVKYVPKSNVSPEEMNNFYNNVYQIIANQSLSEPMRKQQYHNELLKVHTVVKEQTQIHDKMFRQRGQSAFWSCAFLWLIYYFFADNLRFRLECFYVLPTNWYQLFQFLYYCSHLLYYAVFAVLSVAKIILLLIPGDRKHFYKLCFERTAIVAALVIFLFWCFRVPIPIYCGPWQFFAGSQSGQNQHCPNNSSGPSSNGSFPGGGHFLPSSYPPEPSFRLSYGHEKPKGSDSDKALKQNTKLEDVHAQRNTRSVVSLPSAKESKKRKLTKRRTVYEVEGTQFYRSSIRVDRVNSVVVASRPQVMVLPHSAVAPTVANATAPKPTFFAMMHPKNVYTSYLLTVNETKQYYTQLHQYMQNSKELKDFANRGFEVFLPEEFIWQATSLLQYVQCTACLITGSIFVKVPKMIFETICFAASAVVVSN